MVKSCSNRLAQEHSILLKMSNPYKDSINQSLERSREESLKRSFKESVERSSEESFEPLMEESLHASLKESVERSLNAQFEFSDTHIASMMKETLVLKNYIYSHTLLWMTDVIVSHRYNIRIYFSDYYGPCVGLSISMVHFPVDKVYEVALLNKEGKVQRFDYLDFDDVHRYTSREELISEINRIRAIA